MAKLVLEVVTQERHLLTESVDQVSAPTVLGEITVLPGHIPLFTKLQDGVLKFSSGNKNQELAVFGGFMDVGPNNQVTVLADSAVRAEELSIAKAEEARKKAELAMKEKKSDQDFRQAEASLRKALLELKVARRRQMGGQQIPGQE